MTVSTLFAVTLAMSSPGTDLDQRARQIPANKLPQGWNQAKATSFVRAAISGLSKHAKSAEQQDQKRIDAVKADIEAVKSRITSQTRSDAAWTAFISKAEQITKEGGPDVFKNIKTHYNANRTLVQGTLQRAQFNSQLLARAVGAQGSSGGEKRFDLAGGVFKQPARRSRLSASLIERAPYHVSDATETKSGLGVITTKAEIRDSDGRMTLESDVSGGVPLATAMTSGFAGVFVTAPEGVERIRVTVQYDLTYHIGSWAATGLVASGYVRSDLYAFETLNFTGGEDIDVNDAIESISLENTSIATSLAWLAEEDDEESGQISIEVDVEPNGTYLFLFRCRNSAAVVGGGGIDSNLTMTPLSFVIEHMD